MPAYLARLGAMGPVKIGQTATVNRRLDQISSGLWEDLHLLRLFDGGAATEAALHRRFAHLRIRGEWFHFHSDMMGDVGFTDVIEDNSLTQIGDRHRTDPRRAALAGAIRSWMEKTGFNERSLARAIGLKPASVSEWILYGHLPRLSDRKRLIELGAAELAPVFAAEVGARRSILAARKRIHIVRSAA